MPGDNFSAKTCNCINDHYVVGELYVKFIKDNCKIKKEQGCALCKNGWQGPKMDRIPRPFPNKETFRYKSVLEFPSTCLDRKTRPLDDFMPGAQIRKYLNKES